MRFERVRSQWRPLVLIGVIGLVCVAGFVTVYVVGVRTMRGRLFGDASLRGALLTRPAFADSADSVLNVVSVASLLGAVALVAVIALARLARVEGLAAVGLLVGANLSTQVLKGHLLERPDLGISEVAPATLNSLPSGHTTAIASAVAALLIVLPLRWRYPTALVGLIAAVVIALATLSAGWHRASDSMAAFLLVGAWTAIAAAAVVLVRRAPGPPGLPARPPWVRWAAVLSVGLLMLGLLLVGGLQSSDTVRDSDIGYATAFVAACLLIVATGIGTMLGMLAVVAAMRPADPPRPDPPTPAGDTA
ncbi:phosphatase PAP2 family protein [Nocardioides sp. YIM 152588]|uniref:phosphatase PAP2 family protein n=1 Tax=Nocardioides sp. YIM 152588 TaxID=3158259 RepID=UPI0032E4D1F3